MSGWHPQPADDSTGAASWRALSGDPVPVAPQASGHPAAAPLQPIYGAWQHAWQDETGQWYYPYAAAQPVQSPPYDPAAHVVPQPEPAQYATPQPQIVPERELAPVGPPRHYAPARAAQDPRRRTLAAVITFVSLIIGLWAILGFMGSMSKTLSSVSAGTSKLEVQLAEANDGLSKLDAKTSNLEQMSEDTKQLAGQLTTIDGDMGSMLEDVDTIAEGMKKMDGSLGTLDGEVTRVNGINAGMAAKLGTISDGLGSQVKSVRTMRRDVQGTGGVLGSLPGRLSATNARLAHVNNSVNIMGCGGITNNLEVTIFAGPLSTGTAKVYATVVPPGAWGTLADGRTPCPTR